MPLTDTAIKALRPKDKPYKIFDGGGLYIEVLPTGTKLYTRARARLPEVGAAHEKALLKSAPAS